ncbi:MAG TPA: hypothetical protein PKJ41_17565 [Bryobacteraceae bacterium]|nr:hypothetical protein [Bryobacteraceae bacterium]
MTATAPRTPKTITDIEFPQGLSAHGISESDYRAWVKGRARNLRARDAKPDRNCIEENVKAADYYEPINLAVSEALVRGDFYTGEDLGWGKLGKQEDGKKRDSNYPTLDHVDPDDKGRDTAPILVVCRDDTNKMKSDMRVETLHQKVSAMTQRGMISTQQAMAVATTKGK